MLFEKQQSGGIEVENNDVHVEDTKQEKRRHGRLLPNTIRGILAGSSGCGKTNAMLSLIENKNGLAFENIYIYSKSLHQPKYIYLKKLIN